MHVCGHSIPLKSTATTTLKQARNLPVEGLRLSHREASSKSTNEEGSVDCLLDMHPNSLVCEVDGRSKSPPDGTALDNQEGCEQERGDGGSLNLNRNSLEHEASTFCPTVVGTGRFCPLPPL